MKRKYNLIFDFFNNIDQCNIFINSFLNQLKKENKYLYKLNKNIKGQLWTSEDKKENKILLWYRY